MKWKLDHEIEVNVRNNKFFDDKTIEETIEFYDLEFRSLKILLSYCYLLAQYITNVYSLDITKKVIERLCGWDFASLVRRATYMKSTPYDPTSTWSYCISLEPIGSLVTLQFEVYNSNDNYIIRLNPCR